MSECPQKLEQSGTIWAICIKKAGPFFLFSFFRYQNKCYRLFTLYNIPHNDIAPLLPPLLSLIERNKYILCCRVIKDPNTRNKRMPTNIITQLYFNAAKYTHQRNTIGVETFSKVQSHVYNLSIPPFLNIPNSAPVTVEYLMMIEKSKNTFQLFYYLKPGWKL